MKGNQLVWALAVCGALPATAAPSGKATTPTPADNASGPDDLRLEVVDLHGAPVSSFNVDVLCGRLSIFDRAVHATDGAVTVKCTPGDVFVGVSAPHFRPASDHLNLVSSTTMHVVLRSSPTIHVRLRDASTQKPIDAAVGKAYAAQPFLQAAEGGFDIDSFSARKFGLMISAPGYMPLLVGMPGDVEVDTTLDFALRRLTNLESPTDGYDAFGIGIVRGNYRAALIKDVITGSAAANRLMPGDVLVNIDGKPVDDFTLDFRVRDLLLGLEGTPVKVTVRRGTEMLQLEFVRSRYYDTAKVFPEPIVPGPLLAAPSAQ